MFVKKIIDIHANKIRYLFYVIYINVRLIFVSTKRGTNLSLLFINNLNNNIMNAIELKCILGATFYYGLVIELLNANITYPFKDVNECNVWIFQNYILI